MAHIKEPKGIDFLIQSPPLTEQERKEISELIKKLKTKTRKSNITKKRIPKKKIAD
jgi:hypothetical protein